jgi:hypothetical protein
MGLVDDDIIRILIGVEVYEHGDVLLYRRSVPIQNSVEVDDRLHH